MLVRFQRFSYLLSGFVQVEHKHKLLGIIVTNNRIKRQQTTERINNKQPNEFSTNNRKYPKMFGGMKYKQYLCTHNIVLWQSTNNE